MRFIFIAVMGLLWSGVSAGFQIYPAKDQRINPAYKSFTYYLSSTYYNFAADENIAITDIHREGIRRSLDILEAEAERIGLTIEFTFGGEYEVSDALGENYDQNYNHFDFDRKFYFDFTSEQLWGRQFVATGTADGRTTSDSGGYLAGGVVRLNSDFLNFIHPDVNMSSTIIHEVLHIFGLDHSTASSAIMAYTEFWYPVLSMDDLLALRQVYDLGNGSELTIHTKLKGNAAPGVEVVLIDTETGIASQIIADSSGVAKVQHLDEGEFLVGVRELTPTGPCFNEPTRGFLTTFYRSNGNETNDPSQATPLQVEAGKSQAVTIDLIAGQKQFDCHYARITALSDEACNASSFAKNTFAETCYLHMTKGGARFTPFIINDLVTTNHSTDTNLESGAHSKLELIMAGTNSALTVHDLSLRDDLANHHVLDLEVGAGADDGIRAAYCTHDGEFALISSLIEVQDFKYALTNEQLMPELADQMALHSGSRNFSQSLRPGDENPGTGRRPSNDPTTIGGSTLPHQNFSSNQDEEDEEEKKWWQCGVAGEPRSGDWLLLGLVLLLPLWRSARTVVTTS